MNTKSASLPYSTDRLNGQISLATAHNLPFHLFLLNNTIDCNNKIDARLHVSGKQHFTKGQMFFKANIRHFQKYKIKINESLKQKAGIKEHRIKQPQTHRNQKYNKKSRVIPQNVYNKKAIFQFSRNQDKQLKQEVSKQNAMVIGLQEFQNKRQKNIMKKIFQKTNLQVTNGSSQSINLSSSYLLPIEEKKLQIEEQNFASRRISEQDYLKLQQIMDYHETQKQKINNFISLPVSPKKQKQKIRKKQSEVMTKIFQNNIKNGMNSKKCRFIGKMNNICIQIKNKQAKLNNYFQQIGNKFSVNKNSAIFHQQISNKLTVNQKSINDEIKNIMNKQGRHKINEKQNETQIQDIDIKDRNNVPQTFLNTLNYFYTMQRKTDNSNCRNEKKRRRQVYSSNTSRKMLNQFSDQKVFILNNHTPENQKSQRQSLMNKTGKIQHKFQYYDN